MCGIAYLPTPKKLDIEISKEIMSNLTEDRGGDGMGLGFFNSPKITIVKDKQLKNPETVVQDNTKKMKSNMFVYHTRKASKGIDDTSNCQPFPLDPHSCLVHNGTWYSYDDWAKQLLIQRRISMKGFKNFSDTKIITLLIQQVRDVNFLDIVNTGVFLHFKKDRAILRVYSGDFEACKINGVWCFASTFREKHENHVEFDSKTLAVLSPNGYKIIRGDVTERTVTYRRKCNSGNATSYYYNNNTRNWSKKQERKPSDSPDGGYKTYFVYEGERITTLHTEDGDVVKQFFSKSEKDTKEYIEEPKKAKIQRNMLNGEEKQLVKEFKESKEKENDEEESPNEKQMSLVKSDKSLFNPRRKTTPLLYVNHTGICKKHLEMYVNVTHNVYDPIENKKVILEFSDTDLATCIKGMIMELILNKSLNVTVHDIRDVLTFLFGEDIIKSPWNFKRLDEKNKVINYDLNIN